MPRVMDPHKHLSCQGAGLPLSTVYVGGWLSVSTLGAGPWSISVPGSWGMQIRGAEGSHLLPATPLDIPNMFTFWEDRRPNHHPEPLQHVSLVHSSRDIPLHSDYRPGQIESRLELLQAQLSRWAGHRVGEHLGRGRSRSSPSPALQGWLHQALCAADATS